MTGGPGAGAGRPAAPGSRIRRRDRTTVLTSQYCAGTGYVPRTAFTIEKNASVLSVMRPNCEAPGPYAEIGMSAGVWTAWVWALPPAAPVSTTPAIRRPVAAFG